MNCIMIDDCIQKIFAIQLAMNLNLDNLDYHQNFSSGINALHDNIHSVETGFPQVPFDLLILDMHFPISPGREASKDCGLLMLRELKKRNIKIPTVLFSSDKIKLTDELHDLGVIDIIPIDEKDLKGRLNDLRDRLQNKEPFEIGDN